VVGTTGEPFYNENNTLQKSGGETDALSRNEYFERRPHPPKSKERPKAPLVMCARATFSYPADASRRISSSKSACPGVEPRGSKALSIPAELLGAGRTYVLKNEPVKFVHTRVRTVAHGRAPVDFRIASISTACGFIFATSPMASLISSSSAPVQSPKRFPLGMGVSKRLPPAEKCASLE
jgi:hypothetical protein